MVERRTGPTPVPSLRNCTGRLADGHTVPQPRRPEPAPPGYYPPRRGGVVATIAVCAVIVVVLMAAGIAGVLR